jgi:hypothetical protein
MRIPIVNLKPTLKETRKDWQANVDALMERGFFILGPELARFESELAAKLGAKVARQRLEDYLHPAETLRRELPEHAGVKRRLVFKEIS